MKRLNERIRQINFKKVIIVYIVLVLVAGIGSAAFLGYNFREKLTFLAQYEKVNERVVHNRQGVEAVKSDLTALAQNSSDLVDILILDKDNVIMFSAKNSPLARSGSLNLQRSTDGGKDNRYFIDEMYPDVYFKLQKGEDLVISTASLEHDKNFRQGYDDNYFFEGDFGGRQVYGLTYVVDRATGDKVYFISDVQPVPNGMLYLKIIGSLAMLFFMIYWVLIALWVYADAAKSRQNAVGWGLITLFTNLAGVLVYVVFKSLNQTCFKCGTVQTKCNGFCVHCGAKIGRACAGCGGQVGAKDEYCTKCGAGLGQKTEE